MYLTRQVISKVNLLENQNYVVEDEKYFSSWYLLR